jgi:prepilin-type N-terminal cleavage/methylation domain-containing protein
MSRIFTKGFTLIELLVVISIIGLLSSVVLASLNSARAKAKDAAVRQSMTQFRILLEQEYNDTGSYADLQTMADFAPGSTPGDGFDTCDSIGTISKYSSQAREMCKNIIKNNFDTNNFINPGASFMARNDGGSNNKYSVVVWLPGEQKFLCMGSSGTSVSTDPLNSFDLGCTTNP